MTHSEKEQKIMPLPQILATIGPSSSTKEQLSNLIVKGVNAIRINFSWGNTEEHEEHLKNIRAAEQETQIKVPILIDLPGPRIQEGSHHTYNHSSESCLTEEDKSYIQFGISHNIDYFGLSFVSKASDIKECRELISHHKGNQKIIAKIERPEALKNFDEILEKADAIMIARGDLGENVPIEQLPFIQASIIKKTKKAKKLVIVATQMLYSMTENPTPTRAEVTDVANAILQGADVVMLSEETANGKYPEEAVLLMKKIINESEKHLHKSIIIRHL